MKEFAHRAIQPGLFQKCDSTRLEIVARRTAIAFFLCLVALVPRAVQAQTTISVPSAILQSNTSHYADAQLIAPSTIKQFGGTDLDCYFSDGTYCNSVVLVFQLPNLNGQSIGSANLTITGTTANPNNTDNTAVDLYAVRWHKNTSSGTDTNVLTTDFPYQLGYEITGNNGTGIMNDLLPLSTRTALDGTYSTNSAAQTALGTWLQAQYNAGASPGDYVFLRLNVNSNSNGFLYYGWFVNSANAATGKPVLTITTAAPVNEESSLVTSNEVFYSGSNSNVRAESGTIQIGRVSELSAGVCCFALPNLEGATITSAQFQFTVSGTTSGTHTTNINLEAVRSGTEGSPVLPSDYTGIGSAGTMIEPNIALWSGSTPQTYLTSTAASGTLASWIASQYAAVGAGGEVFLRLEPSQDPVYWNASLSVPEDSVQLVITTNGNITQTIYGSGVGNTVSSMVGNDQFTWTFDQAAQWGHFIDGQPWVVIPTSGSLNLVAASPSRLNNQSVYVYTGTTPAPFTADINITVKNPIFDGSFNGSNYTFNSSGVFGWDSRGGHMNGVDTPLYNASLGWSGTSPMALAVGDSITTPCSMTGTYMPSRATMLDAMGVLTVLGSVPPDDAFRPAVIRTGSDRTNPTIVEYSNLISNLDSYLIPSPIGSVDLSGGVVTTIPPQYRFYELQSFLNGPWFINTGNSESEGASAIKNNTTLPITTASVMYGGYIGQSMGEVGIGCLAGWLSPSEREACRILYIQRAIDVYGAVKAGVCLQVGAGVLPGFSTLLTNAGFMLNNAGMESVNNGIIGASGTVKPYWIFADYATMWHTDGVPSSQLFSGETTDRLVPLYSSGTIANYPEYNKAGISPVIASSTNTMTMSSTFRWGKTDRPIEDIVNMKIRITGGSGAGSTIYTITNAVTSGTIPDSAKFRTTSGTLYATGDDPFNFVEGGMVQVKPNWQNGLPDSTSVLTMSITANDPTNPVMADNAKWYYNVVGVMAGNPSPETLDYIDSMNTSPTGEYASIHAGATIDNLIVMYALGAQNFYKGGLDQYLIEIGKIPGYGEVFFQGVYLNAVGYDGASGGNMHGALWNQLVLAPSGTNGFVYTTGSTTSLPQQNSSAKLWNEP